MQTGIFGSGEEVQPSLERVNVNGLSDCEIEETSSSSETRLFSFFSPEKRSSAFAALASPQTKTKIETMNLALIGNGIRDAARMWEN